MAIQNKQAGFTVVEMLILIIIAGILAGVVSTTFNSIQSGRHNRERKNEIKLIQKSLENYYAQHEKYPSLESINDASWFARNIKNLSLKEITDPQSTSAKFASTSTKQAYSYEVKSSSGEACNNASSDCATYVLTANLQGESPYVQNNYY